VAWGAVIIAGAIAIGWRRARVDFAAVVILVIVIGAVLAYTYRTLGS
jgi:hypothetical protein